MKHVRLLVRILLLLLIDLWTLTHVGWCHHNDEYYLYTKNYFDVNFMQLATSPIRLYFSGSHIIFIVFVLPYIVPDDGEEINLLIYLSVALLQYGANACMQYSKWSLTFALYRVEIIFFFVVDWYFLQIQSHIVLINACLNTLLGIHINHWLETNINILSLFCKGHVPAVHGPLFKYSLIHLKVQRQLMARLFLFKFLSLFGRELQGM